MTQDKEDKGFTVKERRFFEREESKTSPKEEKKDEKEERKEKKETYEYTTEIDFASFIISLSSSVLLHIGDIADPITKKKEKNLPLAKQTIDILGMLKEKTKGNLNREEQQLFDEVLYNLRMRYVNESKKTKS